MDERAMMEFGTIRAGHSDDGTRIVYETGVLFRQELASDRKVVTLY